MFRLRILAIIMEWLEIKRMCKATAGDMCNIKYSQPVTFYGALVIILQLLVTCRNYTCVTVYLFFPMILTIDTGYLPKQR